MRRIDSLLATYGESHQNPTNKRIHWVCVPVIVWTVMAGLWSIPFPVSSGSSLWLNWLSIVLAGSLLYYATLSPRLALGFAGFAAICYTLIWFYVQNLSGLALYKFALLLFVLAWIGQFWGHKIEGKRPSFFQDLQFLLIGPAWLLSFLYKRAGLSY